MRAGGISVMAASRGTSPASATASVCRLYDALFRFQSGRASRLRQLGVRIAGPLQADLDRVAKGAKATFIPVDGETLPFVVAEVARTSTRVIDVPELSSLHDGLIAVRRTSSGSLVPDRGIYRLVLTGAAQLAPTSIRTAGSVVIEASARSAADLVDRRVLALVLRECSM
jgi:hypothetical protein